MENNNEVLLKVEHLCQYFRMGRRDLKAVDDVSFEVKKGEVFGLVGESGCGKTTTGRSIIKLYDITSGNVYFKGQRVGAGTRLYKDAIENARKQAAKEIKQLRAEIKIDACKKEENEKKIAEINEKLGAVVDKNRALIRDAKVDGKGVDKQYAASLVAALEAEYEEGFQNAEKEAGQLKTLKKEFKLKLREANLNSQEKYREYTESLIAKLKKEYESKIENATTDKQQQKAFKKELSLKIREAKQSGKEKCNEYTASLIAALEAEYTDEKFKAAKEAANVGAEKLKELKKEFASRCRVAKKSKLITQIQMIFQDPIASLDPRMTVREIIAEGLIINGICDKEYITEKVYEILEMVGLVREHADRYPHEFSGGQRQRIGIARAIIMQPEMIIADEPISALDVSIQAQVINLLNDLRERLGLTILFIAHDLSVVKYFSDRIGVMYFGKMVELASSDELFKNPLHPYTRSLLSAIPLPDPIYEKKRVRMTYNPIAEHDYSVSLPSMREVSPGHFVYCNDAEEAKYKEMLK